MDVKLLAQEAKAAAYVLPSLTSEIKNQALKAMAQALRARCGEILKANEEDLLLAKKELEAGNLKPTLYSRLHLTQEKLDGVIRGIEEMAALPDPVGKVLSAVDLDEG